MKVVGEGVGVNLTGLGDGNDVSVGIVRETMLLGPIEGDRGYPVGRSVRITYNVAVGVGDRGQVAVGIVSLSSDLSLRIGDGGQTIKGIVSKGGPGVNSVAGRGLVRG